MRASLIFLLFLFWGHSSFAMEMDRECIRSMELETANALPDVPVSLATLEGRFPLPLHFYQLLRTKFGMSVEGATAIALTSLGNRAWDAIMLGHPNRNHLLTEATKKYIPRRDLHGLSTKLAYDEEVLSLWKRMHQFYRAV